MTTTAKGDKPNPSAPDWEAIELDYRAGIKTLRQIAGEHGITHGAVNKRAKANGWERDLSAKIQQKADALVSKSAVSTSVSTETKLAERQVIEANAEAVATVRLAHRRDIQRSRSIVMRLLDELELQTGPETVVLLEQLGDLMRREDDKGQDKLNDLYHKLISLPGRAKTMKDLGESLRVLVLLERQAFGFDAPSGADGSPVAGKDMTDAERAVRLSRLLNGNPGALAALLGSAAQKASSNG
ncbi:hypothetical protein M2D07_006570 [Pseudomonas sp. BGr12]|uniref:hypothetical protein n=1 Tax=Pseudomonas sp. BGr12 TaxID=2936269 RepID=UPI002559A5D9|nr:hypothetical protein [Pseudomonas sp. BJa5]MDL2426678.1 hypothetical protein [Pseudomonas sp. BJa5]